MKMALIAEMVDSGTFRKSLLWQKLCFFYKSWLRRKVIPNQILVLCLLKRWSVLGTILQGNETIDVIFDHFKVVQAAPTD